MNEKLLTSIGLSLEQAKIYLFLLENGLSPVKIISARTGIGRAFIYKILSQLAKLDLVESRDDLGKITLFAPKHPKKIKDMISQKRSEFEDIGKNIELLYGKMASDFNLLSGKPNVQFFEGVDGIKSVYGDIIETGKDIHVISSPIDEGRTEVLHLIREQIQKQVANQISIKAITPIGSQEIATPISEDETHLITRKQIPAEKLNIPAQIIIYGDKVAITNFKEQIITVVVESKYIQETFKIMFDYIWNHG